MDLDKIDVLISQLHNKRKKSPQGANDGVTPVFQSSTEEDAYYQDISLEPDEYDVDDPDYIDECDSDSEDSDEYGDEY